MLSDRQSRILLRLLISGLVTLACGVAAFAQDARAREADQACIALEGPLGEAVTFVEESYGTELPEICIRVVSKDAIADAFKATAGMPEHMPEVGGLYVIAEETILIPSDLDPNRVSDLSFIVHEVVHAYQHQAGLLLPDAKLGPLECEAYFVQAAFLRSRGLPREALLMSLQGELQMGSVCEY